jgi:uncharacterized protein YjbI with pentapeptide repeats
VIHEGDHSNQYCDLDLRNTVFEGLVLEGAHFDDSNLEGANFRAADLYWGNFFLANLTGADFEGAQLRGGDCTSLQRPQNYAQPSSLRARPAFHTLVMWAILSPSNCIM